MRVGWYVRLALLVAAWLAVAILWPPSSFGQTNDRTTTYGVVHDPTFDALPGATAEFGFYDGGAYRIEVPDNWNGGLVLFAHGYRGDSPDIMVSDSPMRNHLIQGGYAWAASSYRGNGYRPDWGMDDTLQLRDLFIQRHGPPTWTILHGQSMGGHVLVASLELHPDVYQGGLAECGVVTGEGEIDFLAAYTAAAEFISGVRLLDIPDPATFGRTVQDAWLPTMGTPGAYTAKGQQFDSVVKYLMGGDLPRRLEGLADRYTANLLPRGDPARAQSPSSRAVNTRSVQYQIDPGLGLSEEDLNAGVRRLDPAPGARSGVFSDFSGAISVPLLTIHTTADAYVPFSLEEAYRQKTLQAGTQDLLVQRAIRRPGHCAFTRVEREQAFDDLVGWMQGGPAPDGDDVLSPDLSGIGLRWTAP
jgi:hypothetical protein